MITTLLVIGILMFLIVVRDDGKRIQCAIVGCEL